MSKSRVKEEIRLIIILAVISVVLFAGIFFAQRMKTAESADVVDVTGEVQLQFVPFNIALHSKNVDYELIRNEGTWKLKGYEGIDLASSRIALIGSTMGELEPARIIFDGREYFSKFGLDNPSATLELSDNENQMTYYLGNHNEVTNQYYLTFEGSDDIFMIGAKEEGFAFRDLLDLIAPPTVTSLSPDAINKFEISGKEGEFEIAKGANSYKAKIAGKTVDVGNYQTLNIFYLFNSASYKCESFTAKESDYASYGLDDPYVTVKFVTSNGTYEMKVSGVKDGKCYITQNDDGKIYSLTERDFNTLTLRTSVLNFFPEG